MEKYIGHKVELIYQDASGKFTKRVVKINSIRGDFVLAFCYERKQLRTFKLANILAVQPVRSVS